MIVMDIKSGKITMPSVRYVKSLILLTETLQSLSKI